MIATRCRRRPSRGLRTLGAIGTTLLLAAAVLAAVFVVGMRRKSVRVQDLVRRMNKACINRSVLETAGRPGASASVVRHVGRRSGTTYETPVVPAATEDGFVIALPYGTRADWVRNVLDAGTVTLIHEGETFELGHPLVVPTAEVDGYFDESERSAHRAFHVDECLRLRRAEAMEPVG